MAREDPLCKTQRNPRHQQSQSRFAIGFIYDLFDVLLTQLIMHANQFFEE